MNDEAAAIERTYLILTLFYTLAASFIWGVNTLFLLDAGLSNAEAFGANAFFTLGQVFFEVPTGIIADTWGRRVSYLLGTLTLALSTFLYLMAWVHHAPFFYWAITSILLGLGFTFFSGATEAWLVDALEAAKYKGKLESVFSKAQIVGGIAMLVGSVTGGLIAQAINLGVPYILRTVVLLLTFSIAFVTMKDRGFTPKKHPSLLKGLKTTFVTSFQQSFNVPSIRWIMITGAFGAGVSFYAFYAMQPYLLQLYGDKTAYGIAGLAAAIIAGAQIIGGLTAPQFSKVFKRRTDVFGFITISSVLILIGIGLTHSFWIAVLLLILWGLVFSAVTPVRQAYLNGLIPSAQRATVLSFDSVVSSSGGIVIQPILGKAADAWGYAPTYLVGALFQLCAFPFVMLAKKTSASSDKI